jgi:hypothetical protein
VTFFYAAKKNVIDTNKWDKQNPTDTDTALVYITENLENATRVIRIF